MIVSFKNLSFESEKKAKAETSEKYRESVKVFLDKINVRSDILKKPTFGIIHNVLIDLVLPEKNEQLRIRTQQQINLISVILKIVEVHNRIDELTIISYTLNKEAFEVLKDLLKNSKIKKLSLFLASSYSFRAPEYYEQLKNEVRELQEKYAVSLCFAWLHLKITLAKCGDNFYQFEGSMNYSTNNMAEQILFENRKETYAHDKAFCDKFLLNQKHKALEII